MIIISNIISIMEININAPAWEISSSSSSSWIFVVPIIILGIIIILDLCSTYYHPGNHHHHPGSFYSLLCTIVLWDYDRYNQNLICSKLIYDISNKQLLTYEDFIYHLFKTYYLKLSHVCQLCTFFGLMERIIFNPKIMCNVRTLYSPCVTDQNYKSNTSICEKGQWRCALSWDPILHSVGKLRRAR